MKKHISIFWLFGLLALLAPATANAAAWLGHLNDAPPPKGTPAAPAIGAWQTVEVRTGPMFPSQSSGQTTTRPPAKRKQKGSAPMQIGQLKYLGGLIMTSPHDWFGGFSGLTISDQGQVIAISDRAKWLKATAQFDQNGAISGLVDVTMASMQSSRKNGKALTDVAGDAEAITLSATGNPIVTFERYHRIDAYASDEEGKYIYKQRLFHNRLAADLPSNRGLESVAKLADGRLMTLSEDGPKGSAKQGLVPGWFSPSVDWPDSDNTSYDDWRPFSYRPTPDFMVTDIAQDPGPSGDVYLLERAFSQTKGVRIKVKKISGVDLQPGITIPATEIAHLTMLHGMDNMEGLALRRTSDNRLIAYLISDDNFSIRQRNILMSFEILPAN